MFVKCLPEHNCVCSKACIPSISLYTWYRFVCQVRGPIRLGYILTSLYGLGIYGPAFSALNLVPDPDLDLDPFPKPDPNFEMIYSTWSPIYISNASSSTSPFIKWVISCSTVPETNNCLHNEYSILML